MKMGGPKVAIKRGAYVRGYDVMDFTKSYRPWWPAISPWRRGYFLELRCNCYWRPISWADAATASWVAVVHHTRDSFMTGTLLRDEDYLRQEFSFHWRLERGRRPSGMRNIFELDYILFLLYYPARASKDACSRVHVRGKDKVAFSA